MKALFLHQNCPGQFKHLAPYLAADPANEVCFITQKGRPPLPGVKRIEYAPHRAVTPKIHPYLASTEAAILNGQAVARVGFELSNQGYRPDIIIGNPGWGETLFLKDVWPDTPLITLSEFFYRGRGSDVGFDAEFDPGRDAILRARARAAPLLLALDAADLSYAPTGWQRAQFPEAYQSKIRVIHDGIDTNLVRPNATASLTLSNGLRLTRDDEVVTYVSRNLEPYRGFHTFMRALPRLLDARPDATIVVVGGDEVSYGSRPRKGGSWRDALLAEVGPIPERVIFTGRLSYTDFLSLMQVTSVHCYLTYPFVLSWSMLEAMAAGALVVGSRTPPVEEVIEDGVNGVLTDFFDATALADTLAHVMETRYLREPMRSAARATITSRYALTSCLAQQIALIEEAINARK